MSLENIDQAAKWLSDRSTVQPKIGLILGSGLSELLEPEKNNENFNWKQIPGFPTPTVGGHEGKLVTGQLSSKPVVLQQGRIHWYEGQSMDKLIFSTRVMARLGIEKLIITNAAGAINEDYDPGNLVIISDHINACGENPLRGPNIEELGPRFPDLSEAYSNDLRDTARDCYKNQGLPIQSGVYVMTSGPSYETPAEIQAFRALGGDLVGMSTVPEVIAANHAGMDVLGISCVTNMAAGLQNQLTHEEVIETTNQAQGKFGKLINEIVKSI